MHHAQRSRAINLQRQLLTSELGGVDPIGRGRMVIRAEAEALVRLADSLDDQFVRACETIVGLRRQLVVTGMGKSGHIARKIAATFAATGTPAIYVHPAEAGHGDMGMLAAGDVLLVLSNSGSTAELRPIMSYARHAGIPIIGIAARRDSPVVEGADVPVLVPRMAEACSVNVAPTTSTAVQLAVGDALAMTVMDIRGVSRRDLGVLHPGGAIGMALAPVTELMHGTDRLPLVSESAMMPHVISTITNGCFGVAGVTDLSGRLIGVITDGDLRRHFASLNTSNAANVMTRRPKIIPTSMPVGDALAFLNENKITAAFVVDDPAAGPQVPVGIIHIHDLLRQGLN